MSIGRRNPELTDKEKFVLVRRFLYEETFTSIAKKLNLTTERIRQICYKALWKLEETCPLQNNKQNNE